MPWSPPDHASPPPCNKLERWEIALIKAMVGDGRWPNDQDILAFFTRPTRSINHRAIAQIRNSTKHRAIKATAAEELNAFIASWPEVDPENRVQEECQQHPERYKTARLPL